MSAAASDDAPAPSATTRARPARRRLLVALLFAGIAPYLVEVIFIIGFNPIWPLDATMFSFTVTVIFPMLLFWRFM